MRDEFDQSTYQVRAEWGVAGMRRLAATDVVVVVDVLRYSSVISRRVAQGETVAEADLRSRSLNGSALVEAAAVLPHAPTVLIGCLRNARAIARAVAAIQAQRGERTHVAVIAAGELSGRESGANLRFAVEDHLGRGAVIDALAAEGIDHTSPEAAAAGASYRSLRAAVRHLLHATGSGRELGARDERAIVDEAAQLDVDDVAPMLVDGDFRAA